MNAMDNWFKTPGKYIFGHPVQIPGSEIIRVSTLPSLGEKFVLIGLWRQDQQSKLLFENENTDFIMIFVNDYPDKFWQEDFQISTPQP